MYLQDIIDIAFELPPVIDIRMLNNQDEIKRIISQYRVSENTANEVLVPTLRYLVDDNNSYPLLLQGPYGVGKSHTLCLLAGILLVNEAVSFWEKGIPITDYPQLNEYMNKMRQKRYLPITIDCLNEKDSSLKNIISDALIKNCSNNFAFRSLSEQAADHLENLAAEIAFAFEKKLEEEKISIKDLIRNLRLNPHDPKPLHIYNDTWKKVINIDIKPNYNFEDILKETFNFAKTEDVIVVLLLDELYNYILAQYSSNQIHDTLGTLQQLAQFCAQNGSRVKLIGVNHISDLSEMGIPEVVSETLRKVMQRFHSVLVPYVASSQTVRKLFPLKVSNEELENKLKNNKFKTNFLNSFLYFSKLNDMQEVDPIEFYPFHPELVRVLPWIVDRFGQSNRTTLQFFKWAYENFQDEDVFQDSVKIISFPELYDYFLSDDFINFAANLKPYVYALGYSLNQVQNISFGPEIVKCLAIRYFASDWKAESKRGRKIFEEGLTSSQIANLLQLDEQTLIPILKEIIGRYIFFDKDTTKYIFLPSIGQDASSIMEDIDKIASTLNGVENFKHYLDKNWIHEFQDRTIYKPIERIIPVKYLFPETKYQSSDTQIAYIFPQSDQVYIDFQALSKSFPNTIFGELEQFNFVLSDFCKYAAIEKMLLDPKYSMPYAQAFLNGRKDLLQRSIELNKSRTLTNSNYRYWWRGILYNNNLEELLEQMERSQYPDFPNLNVSSLRNDKKIASQLYSWIFKLNAICEEDQELLRNIKSILPGLGIAIILEETDKMVKYQIKAPKKDEKNYKIWNMLCTIIEEDPIEGLDKAYKSLEKAPFGLTSPLIDLYLAAYLAMDKGILLRKGPPSEKISITVDTASKILKDVDNYRSRRYIIYKTHGISYEAMQKLVSMYTDTTPINIRSEEVIGQKIKELKILLNEVVMFVDPLNRKLIENMLEQINDFFADASFSEKAYNAAILLGDKYKKLRAFYEKVIANKDYISGFVKDLSIFKVNEKMLANFPIEKRSFNEVLKQYNLAFKDNNIQLLETAISQYKELSKNLFEKYKNEHKQFTSLRKSYYEKAEILDDFYDCCQNDCYQPREGGLAVCPYIECKYSLGDEQAFTRISDKIEEIDSENSIKDNFKDKINPNAYKITVQKSRNYSNTRIKQRLGNLGSQFDKKTVYSSEEIVDIVANWVILILKEGE